jgi:Rit1 N-terminal domain
MSGQAGRRSKDALYQYATPLRVSTMPNSLEASARAYIRRESLDIYNRLHSIEADIAFVNEVRVAYPALPLIRSMLSFLRHLLRLTDLFFFPG